MIVTLKLKKNLNKYAGCKLIAPIDLSGESKIKNMNPYDQIKK